MFFRTLTIAFVVFLAPYAFAENYKCPDYKIPKSGSENKKFEAFLKSSWYDQMKDDPEWAYDIGFAEFGDRWRDTSPQAIQIQKGKSVCLKKELDRIRRQALSDLNKTNYDLFSQKIQLQLDAVKFPSEYLQMNQLGSSHSAVVEVIINMPVETKIQVENILKRLSLVPQKMAQDKFLLQEGLKKGVTAPQVVLQSVPAQFDSILKENPKESILYKPFIELKNFDEATRTAYQNQAVQLIRSMVYPAMQDFKNFVVTTYIPQARKSISIQDLPNGKEWYEWSIRYHTTTNMTAEEIHQLGLNEVARILTEMEEVKSKTGFKKDLKAFNEFLLQDSQFFYDSEEELLKGYRNIAKLMDPVLPLYFKTLPRMTYGVRAIEAYAAPAAPTAFYMSGNAQTGRAAYFQANTYDLKSRPKWAMEALTFHEGVPGHHIQVALAQELPALPDFRKNEGYSAFVEGWGLYAETLAADMGFYKDAYSKYGQLTYEMFRAVRLVVDTGIHSKGWTRDQAIQYFMDHMPKTRVEAEAEIDRYIVWPGQALAYKIGQLDILDLRKKAREALGDRFDIREFHDALLSGGAQPLTILNSRMAAWIEEQKKTKTQFNH
jgi:uncharacterized protein (DUF885 family)